MRLALALPLLIPGLAWAEQTPKPPNPNEKRICEVVYEPNEVVKVVATVGENVTIKFGETETIDQNGVAVSDSDQKHLARFGPEPSNLFYLKAKVPMPAQPIAIRTVRQDASGTTVHRDYQIEWSAILPPLEPDAPPPAKVATTANTPVPEAPKPPPTCYMVRYVYPADVKAAANAKAVASWKKQQSEAAEIALHKAAAIQKLNVRYVAQGDTRIAPSEVWDDGMSTEMIFPGRIPVLLRPGSEGPDSDAQLTGVTIEDNGIVKVHSVLPLIRLRDGADALCIINKGYGQISRDPQTGTTSPDIQRLIKSDK